MANYAVLKAAINAVIKTNGNKEITGQVLNQTLMAIVDSLGENYQFAGVAVPSTNPGTPDQNIFYLAAQAGTYTNFGATVLPAGISMLEWKNNTWSSETFFTIDDAPTAGSDHLVKSGGVKTAIDNVAFSTNEKVKDVGIDSTPTSGSDNLIKSGAVFDAFKNDGGAYDVSVHFPTGGVEGGNTYTLDGAIAMVPQNMRKGGMSIKFVSSSDNKYVQYLCIPDSFTTNPAYWQKIVLEDEICDSVESWENIPLTMHLEDNTNGYYNAGGAYNFIKDDTRRASNKISVTKSEKFKVTTHIRSGVIAAVYFWQELDGEERGLSYLYLGTGTLQELVDVEITVPDGAISMAVCSTDTTEPTLKKLTTNKVSKFYTKTESDAKYVSKSEFKAISYGVKWSVSDYNDEGERCYDAIGLTATIGIGNTDGNSDFDNIYPWSDIKRCNIKQNANGANIVTFEGETGFALDGSNGDVFVRIPKFRYDKYVKDGYEYRVISDSAPYVHPAFIEDGKELNEIFISAFEGVIDSNSKLRSISGVIPTNNEIGEAFLTAAQANGDNYSLYDMRCVDMLWTLMAVEFGKRNSNRILGWGIADFNQPIQHSQFNVTVAGIGVNSVTIGKPTDEAERRKHLVRFSAGQTICICDGTQYDIVAERVITAFSCASVNDNMVITFDGSPIDVTTTMFVGNAPSITNFCETVGNDVKLNWHTGRANKSAGDYLNPATINPCRYRWIENPIGNVWHFLPDVSFDSLQMYVCDNMKDYIMCKVTSPYRAVGNLLPENSDNGNKADVANANYWITQLLNDTFAKAIPFGKSYDKSLVSTKAFGGYYYLYNDNVCIVNGGGFDHLWRCNMLTNRAWATVSTKWYLYGARLMFKNLDMI